MSMDYLLKADEQNFVSLPVSFSSFYDCAVRSEKMLESITGGRTPLECLKDLKVHHIAADHIMNSIDVSDLRALMPNPELDTRVEHTDFASQQIVHAENSRRRNAQYKSIALRALKYDHIEQKTIAQHSPYLSRERKEEFRRRSEEAKDREDGRMRSELKPRLEQKNHSNLLIAVSVFFGYSRELEYHEIRLGRLLKVTDRIEITGDNTLQDLKNAFSCPADFAFLEDFSEKTPTVDDFAKNKFPSAMFFIHDTFYIEPNSDPNWEDPSLSIRNWAASRGTIGPIFVKSMVDQKLGDLTARLGQPYVFIHQGICEHLIVFNQISLKNESHEDVVFPRCLVERNSRRIACDVCSEESAKWVIAEHDDLFPSSPAFLCTDCYKEMCFDTNNEKVCNFIATPYCDRREVGECGKFISELRF